jgi:hypothetical protein
MRRSTVLNLPFNKSSLVNVTNVLLLSYLERHITQVQKALSIITENTIFIEPTVNLSFFALRYAKHKNQA